jgi:glycogen debranching enzyme
MGWKDSGDACVYPDGSQVRQPKALCELQGYAFDAWMRMAEVFDALGDQHQQRASLLKNKAAELKARFEQCFWCEDIGYYAFMLDPSKQPVRTVASNAGHLLCRRHLQLRVIAAVLANVGEIGPGQGRQPDQLPLILGEGEQLHPFSRRQQFTARHRRPPG